MYYASDRSVYAWRGTDTRNKTGEAFTLTRTVHLCMRECMNIIFIKDILGLHVLVYIYDCV